MSISSQIDRFYICLRHVEQRAALHDAIADVADMKPFSAPADTASPLTMTQRTRA